MRQGRAARVMARMCPGIGSFWRLEVPVVVNLRSRHARFRTVLAAISLVMVGSVVSGPLLAAGTGDVSASGGGGGAGAAGCGHEVEVADRTTESTTVFVELDGQHKLVSWSEPVRVRRGT